VIVVDASVAIEISLATGEGRKIQKQLRASNDVLGAPELIDLEVLQVLRRQARRNEIDAEQADGAVGIFDGLPIERFSHSPLRARIWALRENLTAYDAAYFALAELLDAPLWTRDEKFRAVPGHRVRVEIL
jgi:predicted nucleic acid-binding protein